MQIVIDIPDDLYYEIQAYKTIFDEHNSELATVINDGKLLPKGHGRLIDADALEGHRQIQIVPYGNGKYTDITVYYQNDIDIAPTIIEADRSEE